MSELARQLERSGGMKDNLRGLPEFQKKNALTVPKRVMSAIEITRRAAEF